MRNRTKKTKALPNVEFVYQGGERWLVMKRASELDTQREYENGVSFEAWKYAGSIQAGPFAPVRYLAKLYKELK